jgi:hypothetical protein
VAHRAHDRETISPSRHMEITEQYVVASSADELQSLRHAGCGRYVIAVVLQDRSQRITQSFGITTSRIVALAIEPSLSRSSRLKNGTRCPIMFDLTYSSEPVFFRGANRSSSLFPQFVSQESYGICIWRKLIRAKNGCTKSPHHRALLVLPETTWKSLVRSKRYG